jgi:hypothetical protein
MSAARPHFSGERACGDAAFPPVPVTELAPLFDRLAARGLLLGVATMDGTAAAEASLVRLAVRDRIALLAGADSGYGLKPAPGMVLGFCAALKLAPAEASRSGPTTGGRSWEPGKGGRRPSGRPCDGARSRSRVRGRGADRRLPARRAARAGRPGAAEHRRARGSLDRWSGRGERRPGASPVER